MISIYRGVVREGLYYIWAQIWKEGREGATWLSGKNILRSINSKSKSSEASVHLASSKSSKEASTAREDQTGGGSDERWNQRNGARWWAEQDHWEPSRPWEGCDFYAKWEDFEQRSDMTQLALWKTRSGCWVWSRLQGKARAEAGIPVKRLWQYFE